MVEMKSLKMAYWQMQVRFTTPPYIIIVHMLEIIICYNLFNLLIGTKKKKKKERKKTQTHWRANWKAFQDNMLIIYYSFTITAHIYEGVACKCYSDVTWWNLKTFKILCFITITVATNLSYGLVYTAIAYV